MTSHDPISPTDEALRWQLRALRQDMPPTRDLWPGIAARLATSPRHQAPARPRRPCIRWTKAPRRSAALSPPSPMRTSCWTSCAEPTPVAWN